MIIWCCVCIYVWGCVYIVYITYIYLKIIKSILEKVNIIYNYNNKVSCKCYNTTK